MPGRDEPGSRADVGLTTRRATDAERRAALRYEAALLQMLRHPGVTELVRVTDDDGATELTTRSGSDETLAHWDGTQDQAVDTAVIAGVLAALAATCAELHDLGVVHGRIEPQWVAVPPSGQPVLTGFEAAGPIGAQRPDADPPLPPFCDPAASPGRPLDPTIDVFGIGALLEHLLERHPPTPGDPARSARRRLRRLARSATAEAPDRRPDAATLAAAILEAAPAAHLPGDATPTPPSDAPAATNRLERPVATPEPSGGRRRVRTLAMGVAAVLLAIIAMVALGRNRPSATSRTATVPQPAGLALTTAPTASTAPSVDSQPSPSTTVTTQATSAAPTTTVPAFPTTTESPAGPPALDTSVVIFDGIRYQIGGGQRRWAIGDWDCDGRSTLATLDPSSGALTFFEAWPQTGSTRAIAAERVPGAVDLRARSVGDCHELAIVLGDRIDTYEGTGGTP